MKENEKGISDSHWYCQVE